MFPANLLEFQEVIISRVPDDDVKGRINALYIKKADCRRLCVQLLKILLKVPCNDYDRQKTEEPRNIVFLVEINFDCFRHLF